MRLFSDEAELQQAAEQLFYHEQGSTLAAEARWKVLARAERDEYARRAVVLLREAIETDPRASLPAAGGPFLEEDTPLLFISG